MVFMFYTLPSQHSYLKDMLKTSDTGYSRYIDITEKEKSCFAIRNARRKCV